MFIAVLFIITKYWKYFVSMSSPPRVENSIFLQSWVLSDNPYTFFLENGVTFNTQGSGESELENSLSVNERRLCLYFLLGHCPLSGCHLCSLCLHNSREALGRILIETNFLCRCLLLGCWWCLVLLNVVFNEQLEYTVLPRCASICP